MNTENQIAEAFEDYRTGLFWLHACLDIASAASDSFNI